jgi:Uma2 family endonuclease
MIEQVESAAIQVKRRRFTAAEYHRMVEASILTEEDRVELIDGEIRQMSPIDPVHAAGVNRLTHILTRQIGDRFVFSVQNPVQLDDHNEPQPDLAILRWHDDFYEQQLPTPGDVLLLIEVANTSLVYDRTEKLPRYAAAGIAEVWLVTVARHTIEQYANPIDGQYQLRKVLSRDMTLETTTIPDLALTMNQIFGM